MNAGMTGMLATSKAGHDKDTVYIIVKEENEYVYVSDGRLKTLENPKKKNKKHIQIIKQLPKEITEVFTQENFRNEEIKRAIKLYRRRRDGLQPDA